MKPLLCLFITLITANAYAQDLNTNLEKFITTHVQYPSDAIRESSNGIVLLQLVRKSTRIELLIVNQSDSNFTNAVKKAIPKLLKNKMLTELPNNSVIPLYFADLEDVDISKTEQFATGNIGSTINYIINNKEKKLYKPVLIGAYNSRNRIND